MKKLTSVANLSFCPICDIRAVWYEKKYLQIINDRPSYFSIRQRIETCACFNNTTNNCKFLNSLHSVRASQLLFTGMDCELGHARCINDNVRAVIRWRRTLAHGHGKSSVKGKRKERKNKRKKKKEESFPVLINSLVYDETMHPCVSEMKKKKKKKKGERRKERGTKRSDSPC